MALGDPSDKMSVFAARPGKVEADLYNLWRLARRRLGFPMRFSLPGLKELALVIENDHWVVVDRHHRDLPVLAWCDFQDAGRNSLHTPVPCTVNHYHFMASQLRAKVLEQMKEALETQLRGAPSLR